MGRKILKHDITYQGDNFGLAGKIIASSPILDSESCFSRSVIYILTHDKTGTLGVIVNRVIASIKADYIFQALNLTINTKDMNRPVHFGGPVESEKGLILHSNDYDCKPLIRLNDQLSLSSNTKILEDIAKGCGPKDNFLALGYSGWAPGQLETELKSLGWVTIPYSHELIFGNNDRNKWKIAMESVGINIVNFSTQLGHA